MKLSLSLISLGFCIAPAFAQKIATVVFESVDHKWAEEPEAYECVDIDYPTVPIQEIDIKGESPSIECTFYTETECHGQSYHLKDGEHKFSKDFYVGSYSCRNP